MSPTTSCTRSAGSPSSRSRTGWPPRRSPRPRRTQASGGSSTSAASRRRARSSRRTCAAARRSDASSSRSGVPTAVLQAAVVIGSGSASFEMLRHLTERLPLMVVPKWVETRIQPIAIRDVLRYLVGAADLPADVNREFDIGGSDVLTYGDMMRRYAAVADLPKRRMLKVPILSPTLSSLWVGLVTPVPGALARPLVESLRNTVVCREHDIARYVPDPPGGLIGFDEAVRLALVRIRDADVATHWSNASVAGVPSDPMPTDPGWAQGTLYVDERSRRVDAPPEVLWRVIEGIGGTSGWYSWPLAWRVRGWIDRLWGGPGLRRGRRNPYDLQLGDAVDFWRVEDVVDGELLRLRAEMKLPAGPGSTSGSCATTPPARCSTSGPCSPRRACSVAPTGGRSGRSTGSCSAACSATSPAGRGGRRAGRRARRSRRDDRRRDRQRRRTVVVTATIEGRRGVELKPKRTGGSTSASPPRSTSSQRARDRGERGGGPWPRRTRRRPRSVPACGHREEDARHGSIAAAQRGLVATASAPSAARGRARRGDRRRHRRPAVRP